MLNIHLTSLLAELPSRKTTEDGKGWAEWRSLELRDVTSGSDVAEWFYVATCNQYYFDRIVANGSNERAYYVQSEFNESDLLESVRADFENLSFKDWEDFYAKMPNYFMHDETD